MQTVVEHFEGSPILRRDGLNLVHRDDERSPTPEPAASLRSNEHVVDGQVETLWVPGRYTNACDLRARQAAGRIRQLPRYAVVAAERFNDAGEQRQFVRQPRGWHVQHRRAVIFGGGGRGELLQELRFADALDAIDKHQSPSRVAGAADVLQPLVQDVQFMASPGEVGRHVAGGTERWRVGIHCWRSRSMVAARCSETRGSCQSRICSHSSITLQRLVPGGRPCCGSTPRQRLQARASRPPSGLVSRLRQRHWRRLGRSWPGTSGRSRRAAVRRPATWRTPSTG